MLGFQAVEILYQSFENISILGFILTEYWGITIEIISSTNAESQQGKYQFKFYMIAGYGRQEAS